jgi:hypothetical protein
MYQKNSGDVLAAMFLRQQSSPQANPTKIHPEQSSASIISANPRQSS